MSSQRKNEAPFCADDAAERERQAYLDEVNLESTQFGVDRLNDEEDLHDE